MNDRLRIPFLAFMGLVLGTTQFGVVGILDAIAASTGVSVSAAGQLVTAFSLANALGTPLVLMAAARLDRRRVLAAALVALAAGCLATPLLAGFGALVAARALMGVGMGVFYVTSLALATSLAAPGRQASAIATITMGFGASLVLGVPLGRVVAAAHDWRAMYVAIGLVCLLAIPAVARLLPASEGTAPVPLGAQLALLRRPAVATALATTFCLFVGYSVVHTFIAPFLAAATPLDDGQISAALLAFGVATVVGSRLGGFLADRLGVPPTLLGGLAFQALALVALSTIAGTAATAVGLLVLWGVAAWTSGPTLNYNLVTLAPEAPGVLLGLHASVVQLGLAAGAAVGGVVAGGGSVGAIGWTGAGLAAVAAAIAVVSFQLARPPAAARELGGRPVV